MKLVWWMTLGCTAGWAVGTVVGGRDVAADVLLGILGPLAASAVSWLVSERTYRRDPAGLTAVMIAAFAAKLVFFGAFVAVMIGLLSVRPVPFMVSFTGSFIALHLVEAFSLRRLFAEALRAAPAAPGESGPRPGAFD